MCQAPGGTSPDSLRVLAILKFWLRATAFVNLREKCPKWQNWATLSCDMHLCSGLLWIDFKSGFQRNCMHLKLWQNTVISPWVCLANQQPSPSFLMIFPPNQHSTGQLLADLCKMLEPIPASLPSQVLTLIITAGRRGCQMPANTSKKSSGELCGPGDYRQSSDHYHHHYHHQTHPWSNLLLEVKYSYWSVKLLHMQIFSLWSPAMEKNDKIAKIPEWYPWLSLMSWMRDNRILTVNQQEAISSDLLVRGQPFPSKNLVNATRLGHSWLTQPANWEKILTHFSP